METVKQKSKSKRLYTLDGLRGVGGIIVVAYHMVLAHYENITGSEYVNHGYLIVDFFLFGYRDCFGICL